jgi:hypothetical protein
LQNDFDSGGDRHSIKFFSGKHTRNYRAPSAYNIDFCHRRRLRENMLLPSGGTSALSDHPPTFSLCCPTPDAHFFSAGERMFEACDLHDA